MTAVCIHGCTIYMPMTCVSKSNYTRMSCKLPLSVCGSGNDEIIIQRYYPWSLEAMLLFTTLTNMQKLKYVQFHSIVIINAITYYINVIIVLDFFCI